MATGLRAIVDEITRWRATDILPNVAVR